MKIFTFAKRKAKLIFIILILILIVVGLLSFVKGKKSGSNEDPTDSLRTDQVTKQSISNYVSMTGTIAANDSQTVYATMSGLEVLEIRVNVGDKVQKGDVIAILDSSDYQQSLETAQKQLEVDEAKTNLRVQIARENLQDAQIDGLDSWKEGEIGIDQANTDLYYSQISYQQACEDLSYAKEQLQRAKDECQEKIDDLNDKIHDLKKQYEKPRPDDIKAEISNLEDQRDEYQKKLDDPDYYFSSETRSVVNAQRSVESAAQNIERTQRNVDSAIEKHADNAENQRRKIQDASESQQETNLDASVAQNTQKDKIDELLKQIESCSITAPISGVVTSVSMEEGNTVSGEKNTICVISDTSSYKVEGTIDEYDISKISEGMAAVIKTESTGDVEMSGVVSFVSPTPQSTTGASATSSSVVYPVRISIDDIDQNVRIGMTAQTNVLLQSAENVMTVPYDCIGKNADGDYVIYAVDSQKVPDDENHRKQSSQKSENRPKFGGPMGGGRRNRNSNNGPESSFELRAEDIGKEIVVEVGLIADYYVEISSPELKDGMEIYVPSESAISIDNDTQDSSVSGGGGAMGFGPGGF